MADGVPPDAEVDRLLQGDHLSRVQALSLLERADEAGDRAWLALYYLNPDEEVQTRERMARRTPQRLLTNECMMSSLRHRDISEANHTAQRLGGAGSPPQGVERGARNEPERNGSRLAQAGPGTEGAARSTAKFMQPGARRTSRPLTAPFGISGR
jgi:hypothetical protein